MHIKFVNCDLLINRRQNYKNNLTYASIWTFFSINPYFLWIYREFLGIFQKKVVTLHAKFEKLCFQNETPKARL